MASTNSNTSASSVNRGNLFTGIPEKLPAELFETLLQTHKVRIERIISRGHVTQPGAWYDQDRDEWVLLLQGAARICFAGAAAPLDMAGGDYVYIPAHCKHRVEWTDPQQQTLWLAIHLAIGET